MGILDFHLLFAYIRNLRFVEKLNFVIDKNHVIQINSYIYKIRRGDGAKLLVMFNHNPICSPLRVLLLFFEIT